MRTSQRESHFQIWKNRIEQHVQYYLDMNITLDELPDENYRIWFNETNFTPKQVGFYIADRYLYME